MSQLQSASSVDAGFFERFFKLKQHNTSVKTELIAGLTTFLTMVYIVFVNPSILSASGMDGQAVFVTTCIVAALGCIFMGLFTNLPIALAPAMGLNAFWAYSVVGTHGDMTVTWQVGMGAIFWGAMGLVFLTLFKIRYWMIANIPSCLRIGITSGIGLFIALMGFKNSGVIVANPETLVSVGQLASHGVVLGAIGFFIIAILAARNIHAAVLVSIVVTTIGGLYFGDVHFQGIFGMPPSVTSVVGEVDIWGALDVALLGTIFSFMLVNLFDSSGTLIGVTDKAGLADKDGRFPNMQRAMWVDSSTSAFGAFMGTSSVTAFIESSSGVSVGGRTGLTALSTAGMFAISLFFAPLFTIIPSAATTPALVMVGLFMMSSISTLDFDDFTESIPAFLAIIMMPFAYSIASKASCIHCPI